MAAVATRDLERARRIVRPSDFPNGTQANGTTIGNEIARRGLRYVNATQLPPSVIKRESLSVSGLEQLFVDPAVDAIWVPADAQIKAAVAIASRIELTSEIDMGVGDFSFRGRLKTMLHYKKSFPSIAPVPEEFFDTMLRRDTVEVGAFLRGVRQLLRADSNEFWSVLLNRVSVGASFHIHRERIFAVRGYKGPGTDFLLNERGDVFQLPTGDLMIFKGENFYHRQPPPENDIKSYQREEKFDQRILHSMAVYIGPNGGS